MAALLSDVFQYEARADGVFQSGVHSNFQMHSSIALDDYLF
jgi:hypothetical protein